MVLHPYAIVEDGVLQPGATITIEGGCIVEVKPLAGAPEPYVLSPAFVNAHSHLEYRGLQDRLASEEYWPWIRELTQLKLNQDNEAVKEDCLVAAQENRKTGIALIAEHSDRPFAAEALRVNHISGVVFQETITFFERETRHEKLTLVRDKAKIQSNGWDSDIFLTPHAYQTVDVDTLREFGASPSPISIHVAETEFETQLTRDGQGPLAEFHRKFGFDVQAFGMSIVERLDALGLARKQSQFVHCCDVSEQEIAILSRRGVSVAHCPRSNVRLKCPPAPIREMLDAGIPIGLGLDSPASSGAIDMFAEMRCAIDASMGRNKPLRAEEVWKIATNPLALAFAKPDIQPWKIEAGSNAPLLMLDIKGALTTSDLIREGAPDRVTWVH